VLVFYSQGRGCSIELVQALVLFVTPAPLRNHHPTGPAKGCRGAARDILVFVLAGHNSYLTPVLATAARFFTIKLYCRLLGGFEKKFSNNLRIIAALAVCVVCARIKLVGCRPIEACRTKTK